MRIGIETEEKEPNAPWYDRSAQTKYFLVFGEGEARHTIAVTGEELGRLHALIDGVLAVYAPPQLMNPIPQRKESND